MTFRVWLNQGGTKKWKPVVADSLEHAEKLATRRWGARVLSVKLIPRREECS